MIIIFFLEKNVFKMIENKDDAKNKNLIKEIEIKGKNYQIRNGEYGYYISYKKGSKYAFTSIPKDRKPEDLTNDDIIELISKPKFKKK